jgi:hypothetical protein
MPSSESIFLPDEKVPPKKRSRAGLAVRWCLILVLAGVVGVEATSAYYHGDSEKRVREFCQSRQQGAAPTVDELRSSLTGWPSQKMVQVGRKHVVVFSWPSVFRKLLIRAVVDENRKVTIVDVASVEDDDFMTPVAVLGEKGLVVQEPIADPRAASRGAPAKSPEAVTRELTAKIKEAFTGPREALRTGVFVFPVVDADNRIRADGAGLGIIAQYSTICSPKKRMTTDPRHARLTLLAANCWRAGRELDERFVDQCPREVGTPLYVVPRLTSHGENLHLAVEFRGGGQARPDKTFEHDLHEDEIPKVPGLIALDILGHMGIELPPEDRAWVATPQIQSAADAVELSEIIVTDVNLEFDATKKLEAFVNRNPECVGAWDALLAPRETTPHSLLRPKSSDSKVFACSSIQRILARASEPTEENSAAMQRLLEFAPAQRGEPMYHLMLQQAVTGIATDELESTVLKIWEEEGDDYPNAVARGSLFARLGHEKWYLVMHSEDAKWRDEWRQLTHEYMEKARKYLERAVQIGSGWTAHRELIGVARRQELPAEYMQQHFQNAVRLMPSDRLTYERKLMYLENKVLGTPEMLVAFGREALDSGQWDSGIPQLVPRILTETACVEWKRATDYEICKMPGFPELLRDFFQQAMHRPDKAAQKQAANLMAHYGVAAGEFDEAAVAFQRLDIEPVQPTDPVSGERVGPSVLPELDGETFGWRYARYAHWRDRVLAHTDQSSSGRLAAARVALADGRLDDAEQQISAISPADDAESAERERCSRALALGRRLFRDGKIEVSPQEAFDTLAEFQRTSCRGLDRSEGWRVDADRLTWEYPGTGFTYQGAIANAVFFPVGVRHAVISFTMHHTGGPVCEVILHSQAVRDHVVLKYSFGLGLVVALAQGQQFNTILRDRRESILKADVGPGPWPLTFEYGPQVDRIAPGRGAQWETLVHHDVPSTFGFTVFPFQAGHSVSISELKIELRD